jgi:hypothetical protein
MSVEQGSDAFTSAASAPSTPHQRGMRGALLALCELLRDR